MRVVVADDETLLREGLVRLLSEAGFEVVGTAADGSALVRLVEARRPDLALIDIKMPPDHKEEGLVAAHEIRRRFPEIGVLVLSHYLESRYAMSLVEELPQRSGYLLKDRVSEIGVLTDAIRRIGQGECVIDPTIVSRLVRHRRNTGPLSALTERERDILELMAEGHSNQGIVERLFLSPKTVEGHINNLFRKLDIGPAPDYHRRVVAVLTFLRAHSTAAQRDPPRMPD
jgi:DNA-binding NarL/FixJ family response regulator